MKNSKKNKLVIFLQRTQVSIYKENNNKVDTWTFDPALINDLEILDEEKFSVAIDSFINPLKLEGGEAIVLLDSSVYFTQKIELQESKKQGEPQDNNEADAENTGLIEKVNLEQEEKLKFMHSMPFSNVFATILTVGKQKFIFGLNREFYEPFIKELTDRKYEVTYIYPVAVVNDLFGSNGFTVETANVLITSAEKYKTYSFLQAPIRREPGQVVPSKIVPSGDERKRLYMLIGAFALLLIILGGVIMWARARDAAPVAVPPTSSVDTPPPTVAPTANPTATPEATNSAELTAYNQFSVVIRNGTGDLEEGTELETYLDELGFASVTVETVPTQTADTTLIVVKPAVTNAVRSSLQNELINLGYQVSFQESQEIASDIFINLASK